MDFAERMHSIGKNFVKCALVKNERIKLHKKEYFWKMLLTWNFQFKQFNPIACKGTNIEKKVTMKQKFTSEKDLVHIRIT